MNQYLYRDSGEIHVTSVNWEVGISYLSLFKTAAVFLSILFKRFSALSARPDNQAIFAKLQSEHAISTMFDNWQNLYALNYSYIT